MTGTVTRTWETVVGLEIHVHLRTRSKMFCRCATGFGAEPNTNTCPVCLAHPGALPVANRTAVEWTIKEGDPIAGGSVYHLADRMDAGAIAAQDWCFVRKGETARELWERALAPMGIRLLAKVIRHAAEHGEVPATPQDEEYATRAPKLD